MVTRMLPCVPQTTGRGHMLRNQTEAWFTDRTTFHHLSHAKKKQNVMTTGIGTGLRFSVKNDHDDETVTKLRSRSRGRAALAGQDVAKKACRWSYRVRLISACIDHHCGALIGCVCSRGPTPVAHTIYAPAVQRARSLLCIIGGRPLYSYDALVHQAIDFVQV